ncbi:S-layer homology domain-containing protein [Agathobaculum sp.]|uniref:S-layer homology domain-containing protein n=1 Tax=Agathobaculum sp. TaxID=2048138 RepID=UPI002A7FD32C|nr:S-layer homology domain-containing protein [Agathobaculum sp.]MDY3618784.1 S-layer homology domain-containing protein [Agathobaculum sp.]
MKRKKFGRLLSLLTSVCLLLALLPAGALAISESADGSGGIKVTGLDMADASWSCGGGTARWAKDTGRLTLTGSGEITGSGKDGIVLPAGAALTVSENARWTVTGASADSPYYGVASNGSLTVTVAENAFLTVKGGNKTNPGLPNAGLYADGTLKVSVAETGSLTAIGGDGQNYSGNGIFGSGITLTNNGTITATSGRKQDGAFDSVGIHVLAPGLTVSGGGILRCEGYNGITAQKSGTGDAGTVTVQSGTVVALGSVKYGIHTKGGTLTAELGATVLAAGPQGGVYGTVTGNVTQFKAVGASGNPGATLDLSAVTNRLIYVYDDGAVEWNPTAADAPRFSMTALDQSDNNQAFYLSKGVKFPSDGSKTIAVTISANAGIEGVRGSTPAVDAGNSALTFFTPYTAADNFTPQIKYGVTAASADFLGGSFNVNGKIDAPAALRDAAGRLEITEDSRGQALPRGITITPPADHHSELRTLSGDGQFTHLAGSPSNGAIHYTSTEDNYIAEIAAGTIPSGSSSPSTYTVVYKANHENAPKDIRDSGHRSGANVEIKPGDVFAAPSGKAFAGWAESADGAVKYRGGETMKMPSKTLNLYAVWRETAPGLNKTDHIAYVSGYPDGTVRPDSYITREETAMLFYRLLSDDTRALYETDTHTFPDVAHSRWSNAAIATLANAGILKGDPDGTFRPEAHITRAEFAAIAARFDSDEYEGGDLFPDIAGHWAAAEINRAAQKGWVEGDPGGLFRPNDPITRAEAVTLVNRVLERAPETADDLLEGMKTFSDNADTNKWYYLALQEAASAHDYKRKSDNIHETWTALK